MTRTYLMASASALLALAACGQKAEAPVENVENSAAIDIAPPALAPGQTFANMAAASDAFEVETSKLAAEKSESSAVQAFAKQMIAAHTESTTKLKAAAAGAAPAIVPDATLSTDQMAKLAALQGKSGAEFDTAYAAEQVAAHQMALDGLRTYASTGDVPQLKGFAASITPTVAAHLNMAKALKP